MCARSLGTVEGFDVPVLAGWGMVSAGGHLRLVLNAGRCGGARPGSAGAGIGGGRTCAVRCGDRGGSRWQDRAVPRRWTVSCARRLARAGARPGPRSGLRRRRGRGRGLGREVGRRALIFTIAAVIAFPVALGGLFFRAPGQERVRASHPPGVVVHDCEVAEVSVVQLSARLSQVPAGSSPQSSTTVVTGLADVVLTARIADADAALQVGPQVTVLLRPCEAAAIGVGLSVPRGVGDVDGSRHDPSAAAGLVVQGLSRRVHAGEASLYLSDPSEVRCRDGGVCGTWTGWCLTLESAGSGQVSFSVPVRWGARSRDLTGPGGWGVLDVTVWVKGG